VAVKVLLQCGTTPPAADLQRFIEEAAMLQRSQHPCILHLYGAVLDCQPYMLVSEVRKASLAVIAAVRHVHSGALMQA